MWLENEQLRVRPPRARSYHGVDVLITGYPEAIVKLELAERFSNAPPHLVEIPLQKLVSEVHEQDLDDKGNWLQVRRAPGDRLRVRFQRPHLVFAPREVFRFAIHPHQLGLKPNTKVDFEMSLHKVGQDGPPLWKQNQSQTFSNAGNPLAVIPQEITLPEEQGTYEFVIDASVQRSSWSATFGRNWFREAVARRSIQLVVIARQPAPPLPEGTEGELVDQVEPAHPGWWQRFGKLSLIPGMQREPLTAGEVQIWPYEVPDGERKRLLQLIQLGSGPSIGESAWHAYPVTIKELGQPHWLEVDYPRDMPQHLGISIVEPSASGQGQATSLDSGVYVPAEASLQGPGLATHRILFWPRTRNPLVLMSNLQQRGFAVYGDIRIRRAKHLANYPAGPSQRMVAAYFHKPQFAENFSAEEVYESESQRYLQDWYTFQSGAERLVTYLQHHHYNAAFINMVSEGSSLYPSHTIQPNLRYDGGHLASQGYDPIRKDVAEMLFRIFNRENLGLIPTIRFTAPLPKLERLLRRQDGSAVGIELVGSQGLTWQERAEGQDIIPPMYNPLDPRVQDAMVEVVREFAQRYGRHPAFRGLAIDLTGLGYAQLPGVTWGLDDRTMARFQQESGIRMPQTGPARFMERARLLSGRKTREKWLLWRSEQIANLHRRMRAEVVEVNPRAQLYLTTNGLWEHQEGKDQLRQSLPQGVPMQEALLTLGIAPRWYRGNEQPILLRPYQIAAKDALPNGPLDEELNSTSEFDFEFQMGPQSGTLFFHPPKQYQLPSFDKRNPYQPSSLKFLAQSSPSGSWNRQRFAHALASMDTHTLCDGGWQLPLGQEEAAKNFLAVYRQLPAESFEPIQEASQPVTVRKWSNGRESWAYLVNDSAWPVTIEVQIDCPPQTQMATLGNQQYPAWQRQQNGFTWTLSLEPYELVGARFSTAPLNLRVSHVDLPGYVTERLNQEVNDLGWRLASLIPLDEQTENSPLIFWNLQDEIPNAGFESTGDPPNQMPGWVSNHHPEIEVRVGENRPHTGRKVCVLKSQRPVATLASQTFPAPKTGVLLMAVWLRVENPQQQPELRLAVEAIQEGRPYYRYATLGAGPGSPHLGSRWHRYLFRVHDLPISGLSEMRIRFDLMGPGEVWLDDVHLASVMLTDPELIQLRKTVATARFALNAKRYSDCEMLLQRYWAQLLNSDIPLTQMVEPRPDLVEGQAPNTLPSSSEQAPQTSSWYDRLIPSWMR